MSVGIHQTRRRTGGHPVKPPSIRILTRDCLKGMRTDLHAGEASVIVTSPPYNLGKSYNRYDDRRPKHEFKDWLTKVSAECRRVLADDGSFFLNVGNKPSEPWWPFEVLECFRGDFKLQNAILWVKSIAIEYADVGNYPNISGDVAVGHYKPVNSTRYVNGLSEHIFHLTKSGDVTLSKLAVGVPYQDKSNVKRWGATDSDLRDRGNVWFIPYDTIRSRRAHPCVFPVKLPQMCIRLHGLDKTKLVLDPFVGTGTTALACERLGVDFVGFDIDPTYTRMARHAISIERRNAKESVQSQRTHQDRPWERLLPWNEPPLRSARRM
jgi:site-specific DNA-methyltransferase (adenine-specific)